jgi:hypothetical protein
MQIAAMTASTQNRPCHPVASFEHTADDRAGRGTAPGL